MLPVCLVCAGLEGVLKCATSANMRPPTVGAMTQRDQLECHYGIKPKKHIISYHIISYHIISYHIISYHIISYHIISYHIISYHIISYHIISYHIISYHIISYHIISYHIISYICKYTYVPFPTSRGSKLPDEPAQRSLGILIRHKRPKQWAP